jgi:hypothetical protein
VNQQWKSELITIVSPDFYLKHSTSQESLSCFLSYFQQYYLQLISQLENLYNVCTTYAHILPLERKLVRLSNTDYAYDGFVVYCDADRKWVHEKLVSVLEEEYGHKLCIHYRDFQVGKLIVDNTVAAFRTKWDKLLPLE